MKTNAYTCDKCGLKHVTQPDDMATPENWRELHQDERFSKLDILVARALQTGPSKYNNPVQYLCTNCAELYSIIESNLESSIDKLYTDSVEGFLCDLKKKKRA